MQNIKEIDRIIADAAGDHEGATVVGSDLSVSMSIVENDVNRECTSLPQKNTEYTGKAVSRYVCRQLYQELCILSNGGYA